jgi:GxxExxY protein
MVYELRQRGLHVVRQKTLPVVYKGVSLDCGYRIDMIVENRVVLELKCVDRIEGIHLAQLLTYLKLSDLRVGLLMNFKSELLKNGIRRLVNGY